MSQISVRDTVIIIVCCDGLYFVQKNIESIRKTLEKGSYYIYVTDNASTDGTAEYLRSQEDVHLIANSENLGFGPACNQAADMAFSDGHGDCDLFLLNDDTRLCRSSLANLKTALYSEDSIGAVGAVSNYAGNNQDMEIFFDTPGGYVDFGDRFNASTPFSLEERVRLSGFAMLIRAGLWQSLGGMDEAFAPGYFEDDDLSMRIAKAGYRLAVCKSSFIYHAGSQSFSRMDGVEEIFERNHRRFFDKYGFDILRYCYPGYSLIAGMDMSSSAPPAVLVVGGGLGADAKYIRSICPGAVVFSIEKDGDLRSVAEKTEAFFGDADSLARLITNPVFNVLIIYPRALSTMSKQELDTVASMCLPGCRVIQKGADEPDMSRVKLIIWDMDETFWSGTLTEGEVHVSDAMDRLIRDLSSRGIVNSISSKNDWDAVASVLAEMGDLGDYFVFNNINWYPKGPQIKEKLELMGLRSENVLFLDDNPRNLQEALSFCPGLMTASPRAVPFLAAYVNSTPATDPDLERLKRYNILEAKCAARQSCEDPTDFLFDSDIQATLCPDCADKADRICELIGRTNQLNFTKRRDGREEMEALLSDPDMECRYVRVRDRFGDYGIAGFYCLDRKNNTLIHFLFSCRCMGMGIEQAMYRRLGCPAIDIAGPVSAEINNTDEAPWVKIEQGVIDNNEEQRYQKRDLTILLKGPCDLDSMAGFMEQAMPDIRIVTEFNYINSLGFVTAGQNHSMHIWEYAHMESSELQAILKGVPFLTFGDFQTELFDREYMAVCYSLLPDCHAGLYRHRETGVYISFGSRCFDLTDPKNAKGYIDGSCQNHGFSFTEEILSDFAEKWEFVSGTPGDLLVRNLEYIYENLKGSPQLILLTGSELPFEGDNPEFAGHDVIHAQINPLIRSFAASRDRVRILEAGDFIRSSSDYADCINHYSRRVYVEMSEFLVNDCLRPLKG